MCTFRVEMAMSPVNGINFVMWLNKVEDLWLYYHVCIVIFGIFIRKMLDVLSSC